MTARAYEERYIRSADGLQLYYRDYPNSRTGIPVLCLPGLTRNSRDYAPFSRWLMKHRRVICPDFRGRGQSEFDPDWKNYHPAQYTADMWRLLDELGIDRVSIVGTSLGGWMAMLMNHEQPARVVSAVINDIGPEADPDGIARVVSMAGQLNKVGTFAEAVEQVRSAYGIAYPDWSEEQWRFHTETTYRETESGEFDLNFDRNVGHAAREGVSGVRVDPWALFDKLAGLPVLLVHGALSDILTEDIIAKMRHRKPNLRVATVENRGHAPLLDEPEAVDAIASFLDLV